MPPAKQREQQHSGPTEAVALPKVITSIQGLDEILQGGLPAGRTTLVYGGAGSGKSILGLEFLYRRALAGEPGILVVFEETVAAVRQNALTMGWNLASLEQAGTLHLIDGSPDPHAVLSGDFNLRGLLAVISGQAVAMGARQIVFDAVDVLSRLFADPQRERNELYALYRWFSAQGMTAVLTVRTPSASPASDPQHAFLEFMADCVIALDQRVTAQVATRRLRIVKYRGSGFGRNEYPFTITADGIYLLPLSSVSLQHEPSGEALSLDNPALDAFFQGSWRRGACILLTGTAGTGKTTLASMFTQAACARGDKVLYIGFEESETTMVANMRSTGIDLQAAIQAGTLRFLTVIPESIGVEDHLIRVFKTCSLLQPDHIVIDAISSCQRMGSKQDAFEYLMRLWNFCKERGSTCIFVNQISGHQPLDEITGIGLSSLIDTTIVLRFSDTAGGLKRTLRIMKARGTAHSTQYREFQVTDHGIALVAEAPAQGGSHTDSRTTPSPQRQRKR